MNVALIVVGVIAIAGALAWGVIRWRQQQMAKPQPAAPGSPSKPAASAPAPSPLPISQKPAPAPKPGAPAPEALPAALPNDRPQYALTLESGVLECNPAFFAAFGYPPSEPATTVEWWTDHIHPDDALHVNEIMNKLLDRSVNRWTTEYRFRKADGNHVVVRDSSVVQRNAKGEAVRLVGVLQVNPELGS